jgi:hypothetical protein
VQLWLLEVLKGIGRFFLDPVAYYLVILAGILGVRRVKRERKNFNIRAYDAYFELRQLIQVHGLLAGLVLSIIIFAVGITVPLAAILLIAFFTFLWSLTTNVRLMGPVYTVGAAFLAILFIVQGNLSLPIFKNIFHSMDERVYPSLAVLMGLLIVAEGYLILKNGSYGTSPKLIKSKRGRRVGVHEVKRLWLLPVLLLVPGNVVHLPFSWWPVFHIGAENYYLFFVPFAVGFQQKIQGMLPKQAVQSFGKRILILGAIILAGSIAGYWYPLVSIIVVVLAIFGHEGFAYLQKLREDGMPFYFSRKNNGLMILGIIPDSPASKMELKVGELITKVNGRLVSDEKDFYEALQINRAHCRLEVFDTNGEVRFEQRALYEGDHYELGILFVQDERNDGAKIG